MSTVYQNIAKSALMNWNGLSEEEAESKIASESVEELKGQVYAMGSIGNAIVGVSRVLDLSREETEQLLKASIDKTYQKKVERGQLRQYAPLELIGWNEANFSLSWGIY